MVDEDIVLFDSSYTVGKVPVFPFNRIQCMTSPDGSPKQHGSAINII